jgi:hypothetical protein
MKIAVRLLALVSLAGLLQTAPAIAQTSQAKIDKAVSANIGDPAKFQQTMSDLQQAVANHDAPAVAAMVSYPITIDPRTQRAVMIRTPQAFVARYDRIITPHIADVIEKQRYEDLLVNSQGAMFGSGEVWIAGICKDKNCTQSDIRIKTIQNTARNSKTGRSK